MAQTAYYPPVLTYNSIVVNGSTISLSDNVKASYNAGHNVVNIKFKTDTLRSLSCYKILATTATETYGPFLGRTVPINYNGTTAPAITNIPANTTISCSFTIDQTSFPYGNTEYRVGLYAQNAVDGCWDATYLLADKDGKLLIDNDNKQLEVLVVT